MKIRNARSEEAEKLWDIRNRAIRHGCKDVYPPHVLSAWTPEEMPISYRQVIEENPFFVIETENGEPTATGYLSLNDHSVEAIFTLPEYCGKGMAKQILDAIKQEALSRKILTLSLSATPNARYFYEKQGFEVVKAAEYYSKLANSTLACFEMIYDFNEPNI